MMLYVRNLESGYGKLKVLRGVSLHVAEGEVVAIIGANGAGKSTLLKSIAGVLKPHCGEVVFAGSNIAKLSAHRIVDCGCALVPEGRQVFAPMTIEENLSLGGYRPALSGSKEAGRIMENIYSLFPILRERRKQLAGTLSGGEQQMLAIGRALMAEPRLIMLDEPSMGLAPLVIRDILTALVALRKDGKTILLVEQNSKAALGIADRGYVMETGALVLEGGAKDLLSNKDVQRAYLGKEYKRIEE